MLDTLGQMGGIFEIFIFVGSVLYFCFKDRFYNNYMHKKLMEKEISLYKSYYSDLKDKEIAGSFFLFGELEYIPKYDNFEKPYDMTTF